ncbi:hypothetical protein GALMADRAFT_683194 [Galerina marginata CBS 339.88]|uniref:Uncharacterized protein n=1 Tax=Galerina marginata (strain CBS 339.88) TaxID=685588 RepID=A0A067TL62_GALM3|nr:hypothetical protein GALMADRAFT_683194 [Galerina marginata CBS 339.88]
MYEGPVHGGQASSHPVPQVQPGQPQQQPQYAPNHAPMRQDAIILPNGTREIRRASHPTTLNHHAPSGPVPQTMQAHPNAVGPNPTTPIAYGYTSNGNPYPIFPGAPAHGHSNPVPLPAPRRGSAPLPTIGALPNQSPDIPPPPLSALSLLAQNSLFTPPSPLFQSGMVSSTSPTQPAQPMQPMTISPQDTYINPPGATQTSPISVTSPSFPLSGHTPETPIQNAGQSQGQSSVPIPYPYPMPYPPVATPIVANGTPSVPPAPSPSVTHQNPPFSGEPTIPPVEVPQELPESTHAPMPGPEQHMYPPGHDVEEAASRVAEQTHSASAEPPPSNTVTPAPEDQNAMEVDVAQDED